MNAPHWSPIVITAGERDTMQGHTGREQTTTEQ